MIHDREHDGIARTATTAVPTNVCDASKLGFLIRGGVPVVDQCAKKRCGARHSAAALSFSERGLFMIQQLDQLPMSALDQCLRGKILQWQSQRQRVDEHSQCSLCSRAPV